MKHLITILLLTLSLPCKAPERKSFFIWKHEPINPYTEVLRAMSFVESSHNPFAYNAKEGAVGLYQIRKIRLDDYYRLTGVRYYPADMFDVNKSEEVINYYAFLFGAYRVNDFIKSWNCGSEKYLKNVRKYL